MTPMEVLETDEADDIRSLMKEIRDTVSCFDCSETPEQIRANLIDLADCGGRLTKTSMKLQAMLNKAIKAATP